MVQPIQKDSKSTIGQMQSQLKQLQNQLTQIQKFVTKILPQRLPHYGKQR
jgi:hypothetical protein